MSKVLVVDDEERLRSMLCRLLTGDGHETVVASDGRRALERLAEEQVDLVLLDLVMPETQGLQVLASMREQGSETPVIVLSAVGDVASRVKALELGAVDFVGKPFHTAELVARVRRNLPARVPAQRQRFIEAGGIRLDLHRRRAHVRDEDVVLTERELGLLAHLMQHRGDVCTREELLHDVWGLDFDPGSNVVEVCVRRLRVKLGEAPIETVRAVGYCFDCS